MRRRLSKSVAVAVAFATVGLAGAGSALGGDGVEPTANPIKDCLSKMADPRLAVQFLIDESKSLRKSDPQDLRVNAIKSSVATLSLNFTDFDDNNSEEPKLKIDVKLSAFAKHFRDHGSGWVTMTDENDPALEDAIDELGERDNEGYTNYENGLEGAEGAFVEYERDKGGEPACKVLVWLTDGNIDLDNSSNDNSKEDRQRKNLCGKGGVVDRLRSQRVFVIGLGLNSDPAKRQNFDFMSRMLTGDCGDREAYGTFTEVDSADGLIREMFRNLVPGDTNRPMPCKGEESNENCREVEFTVRPPLSRINVLVGLTKDIETASVIDPSGESVLFARDGVAVSMNAGRVYSQPSFEFSTVLRLTVQDAPGVWRLQFRGSGAKDALVMSIFFSDVVVEIDDLPLRIDRREPEPIGISLGDLGLEGLSEVDAPAEMGNFDSAPTVIAELTLGSSRVSGTVVEVPGESGRFTVSFDSKQLESAPSNGVLTLTPVAVLGGQEINFTPRTESVVLVLGDGFPTVRSVSASNVDGNGESTVVVEFDGPDEGTGTARLVKEKFRTTELPAGPDDPKTSVKSVPASQVSVKAGTVEKVVFVVDPSFAANGRFKGTIQVELENSFGERQTQDVVIEFNMTKPFDTPKFLWVLMVMFLSFLLVQGAIIFYAIDRLSRISKVPSETYFARFRARITESGNVEVVNPGSWIDVFKSSTDPVTSSVSGKRRHEFREFSVFGSRSDGWRWLFAGGDSFLRVECPGNLVVGSRSSAASADGIGRISSQLAGEWAVAVGRGDARMLASVMSDSSGPTATYEDHLTGEIRELAKDTTVEAEFLCFVPDFSADRVSELIEDMVMTLATASIHELIAVVGAGVHSDASPAIEEPSTSSAGTPPTSPGSYSSIEDEYG